MAFRGPVDGHDKSLGCAVDPRDDRLTREESHQKGGSRHRSWLRILDSCRVRFFLNVWVCHISKSYIFFRGLGLAM